MININKRPRESSTSVQSGGVHPHCPYNVPKRPGGYNPNSSMRFANSIFNIPVQTHNSQIHQMTNNTASVPLMIKPYASNWHNNYAPGSPLFVCRNASGGRTPLHKVVDIPQLNHILLQTVNTNQPEGTETLRSDDSGDGLFAKYNFFGIYRNDLGKQITTRRTQQNLINFDVFGRSKISNLFGRKLFSHTARVQRGSIVGLAVVEVKCSQIKKSVDKSGKEIDFNAIDDVNKVWQIYPTVNNELPKNFLSNKIVRHIPLGIVSHAISAQPSEAETLAALKDSTKLGALPQIEFLML